MLDSALPEALRTLNVRRLFALRLEVPSVLAPGGPQGSERRVGEISAGVFEGERLKGRVLPGGADWQTLTSDGAVHIDARIVLQTDAEELIGMTYRGIRCGPPEVLARLAKGEPVDPSDYYFRISATFVTSAPALLWLNLLIAVGAGHRLADGPIYNLFEIA